MTAKITLKAEDLYIIRSISTFSDGQKKVQYYESPSVWNSSPLHVTLFTSYEAAESHLFMYDSRDKAKKGWADGRTEVMDVVPLYGEILQSPNAIHLKVKKDNHG